MSSDDLDFFQPNTQPDSNKHPHAQMKVFIVDDDAILRELLAEALVDDYKVYCFECGEECLNQMRQLQPDIVLLDLHLPDIDGLELCRQIRRHHQAAELPVIFVSGDDSMDAKLAGYEAGAQDFLLKPVSNAELLHKVGVMATIVHDQRDLRERAGFAQQTAFTAMNGISDLGIILEFMRVSFACRTVEEVGQAILNTLSQWALQGALQIRHGAQELNMGSESPNSPLEASVLNHARSMGRIFQFKRYIVFNYGDLTLMITNMPLDDTDYCGRIRDNIAILAEGAEARLLSITSDEIRVRQSSGIDSTLQQLELSLEEIRHAYAAEKLRQTELIMHMHRDFSNMLVCFGLTDEQENNLMHQVAMYLHALQDNENLSNWLIQELQQSSSQLRQLAASGNHLIRPLNEPRNLQ
ncbi:DNA-binding response OmpR family regulator [Chitinivorax tropicus]|uniref:DNA-binding response OmpR family regulator n=1 Tax=Chitinivorax tropicus TaxID=714531 RepID=A0A840MVK7_9PROT|nr:response regulator [Chitinivorax tropicus]MBB5020366.1 DNA-binding response OmpR family regulator [Chitinivorax tropicus]